MKDINKDEVQEVSGGFPGSHKHTAREYSAAGIVLEHYLGKLDKFYDNKSQKYISKSEANEIMALYSKKDYLTHLINHKKTHK